MKKRSWRAFITMYIAYSFVIMLISGVVLYIAPAGRVAKWTHIYIIGLEKEQWQALHTIFSFLFIIAGGIHLYFNWRPFTSYLREKFKTGWNIRKETWWATGVTVLIFVLTLGNVPPFSTVMEVGEYFTDSWSTETNEPPVPHAEAMTIQELAKVLQKPAQNLLAALNQQGINAQPTEVVKDVAERYGLTPQELYQRMNLPKEHETTVYAGRGYGRMTIAQICNDLHLPLTLALERLASNKIKASPEALLKDVADASDLKPIDLLNIMTNKNTQ